MQDIQTTQTAGQPATQSFLEMVTELANAPEIQDAPPQVQGAAKRLAYLLKQAGALNAKADTLKIDYEADKKAFLDTALLHSKYTARGYKRAFVLFEEFTRRQGITPLETTPADADEFIRELAAQYSPATARVRVAAISAFFTAEARLHKDIENPFRGTKARPAPRKVRSFNIPTAQEINEIEAAQLAQPKSENAALYALATRFMAGRGFRVGALQSLKINFSNNRFICISKGKEWRGDLSEELIRRARPYGVTPFKDLKLDAIKRNFALINQSLYKAGHIAHIYSPHKLRHFYAIETYKTCPNIYKLKRLLNHSSILTTEKYLRALDLID